MKCVCRRTSPAIVMGCAFFFLFLCSACVGRNLAVLELQIIIASIMRRYDIVLREGEKVSLNWFGLVTQVMIHFL